MIGARAWSAAANSLLVGSPRLNPTRCNPLNRQQRSQAVRWSAVPRGAPVVTHAAASSATAAAPMSGARAIKVQNVVELRHLLRCHPNRVIALVYSTDSCSEALLAQLTNLAQCYPSALVLLLQEQQSMSSALPSAELSMRDVLGSMGVSNQPAVLIMRGGLVLERQEDADVHALCARLDMSLAALMPAAAQEQRRQQPHTVDSEERMAVAAQQGAAPSRLAGANGIVQLKNASPLVR